MGWELELSVRVGVPSDACKGKVGTGLANEAAVKSDTGETKRVTVHKDLASLHKCEFLHTCYHFRHSGPYGFRGSRDLLKARVTSVIRPVQMPSTQ